MVELTSTPTPETRERVHTISVYVSNKPGVLARIALVFARRDYNIESLIVSPAAEGGFSRTTITCTGEPTRLDQIVLQLSKLVDVVHATSASSRNMVETEIALIKLAAPAGKRHEILQIAEHFKAKVVDLSPESAILRISGSSEKLDHFTVLVEPYGLLELVRTGKVAMARGLELT